VALQGADVIVGPKVNFLCQASSQTFTWGVGHCFAGMSINLGFISV